MFHLGITLEKGRGKARDTGKYHREKKEMRMELVEIHVRQVEGQKDIDFRGKAEDFRRGGSPATATEAS